MFSDFGECKIQRSKCSILSEMMKHWTEYKHANEITPTTVVSQCELCILGINPQKRNNNINTSILKDYTRLILVVFSWVLR